MTAQDTEEHPSLKRAVADAEALLAARLERLSLDDIVRQAQPNPFHPQHGGHHHG